MESPDTLQEAIIWFADFEHCRQFMIEMRWPDGKVACPHCGSQRVTWLAKARVWKCYARHERPTFTLKTGTIFEDSPIQLEKWLAAAWLIIGCKNGVSSYEIHRGLGVTQKTAWFMLHRIRLAMQESGFNKLSGIVEADETFVGGKVANMHLDKQTRMRMGKKRAGGYEGKTVVMGLLERHGKAKVKVLPNTGLSSFEETLSTTLNAARPFTLIRCIPTATFRLMGMFMNLSITPNGTCAVRFTRTAWKISGVC